MSVSLHWAQLPNKIDLKRMPDTGSSMSGDQFANLTTNFDAVFLMGECRADLHDTACLHTWTWGSANLSM